MSEVSGTEQIITRSEYVCDKKCSLVEYYSQFLLPNARNFVARMIGPNILLESKDKHLNDIPLGRWDNLNMLGCIDQKKWKAANNGRMAWVLSDNVCLGKTAARIWIMENEKTKTNS